MNLPNDDGSSRRDLLTGAAASVVTASVLAPQPAFAQARGAFAYVGSFTSTQRKARGNGINVYRMDTDTGAWSHVQHVGDLVNPSFLVLSRDQRALYSVHGDENHATAFAVDPESGKLKLWGAPIPAARTACARCSIRAASSSSSPTTPAARSRAAGDRGRRAARPDAAVRAQGAARSASRVRQAGSHPHDIVFDPSGRFVVVPDLGLDRTFVLRFDPSRGHPSEASVVAGRPTSGPRHVAFHPTRPIMWISQLDSTMTTCEWDGERGAPRPLQIISTLRTTFTGNSTAAEPPWLLPAPSSMRRTAGATTLPSMRSTRPRGR